jgi:AcrR family transcriptional regulator
MGIKERKERERELIKEQILDAARELFFANGYEATSIRSIAEKIEYSPGTIYLYFKDKDSIFHDLQREGFNLLNQQMQVLLAVSDPFERLKAMGRVYMQFAKEYTDYYDLMFVIRAPMKALEDDEEWQEGNTSYHFLNHVVKDCQNNGYFKDSDTETFSYYVWATMHGIITLGKHGRNKVVCEASRNFIEEHAFQEFVKMLEKR